MLIFKKNRNNFMEENYKSSQHTSMICTEKKKKQNNFVAVKLEHLSLRLERSEPRQQKKKHLTYL